MQAFEVDALHLLRGSYPPAELLLRAARDGDNGARYAIARLWLSEGIPFAFQTRPAVYEALRSWLARRLQVHPKEVTLVGSGRLGFALIKDGIIGRAFGERSDLDLTVISSALFARLHDDFQHWAGEYSQGTVSPSNDTERRYWDDNLRMCPRNLRRGFIDPRKIPISRRYPEAQSVAQAMHLAREKLKVTRDAPTVRRVSVRVYNDWDSFVLQMALNLDDNAQRWCRMEKTPSENS